MHLPAGVNEAHTLEDEVNLRTSRLVCAETGADICHVEKTHDLESKSFESEAGPMAITVIECLENGGEWCSQQGEKLRICLILDLIKERLDHIGDQLLSRGQTWKGFAPRPSVVF